MNNTSFRDPSGFVFRYEDTIFRKINLSYQKNYEYLMTSRLYQDLAEQGYLIEHEEIELTDNLKFVKDDNFFKLIKPKQIKFITYPYEWCFSELKDAALLTLKIQKIAMKYSMSLKDASAYNIQFVNGKPVFIDTLSFEKCQQDSPWQAYRQFCQHFLGPLALMSYTDINLNQLLITNIDGVPLKMLTKLLPFKTKFNPFILTHIHLHAMAQEKYESVQKMNNRNLQMGANSLVALIESLQDAIKSLKFPRINTEWGEYYSNTNYTEQNFQEKKDIICKYIGILAPKQLCDLGANRGDFSRIASDKNITTLAFDIDSIAIEENYRTVKRNSETNILPLFQDLTNLSPAIGFANCERKSFVERFHCDTVMALALIHHLAISNNLPFSNIAKFFASLADSLIIEFVPKSDSKVQILLNTREDVFSDYNIENFEKEFSQFFFIKQKTKLTDSERVLYLMQRLDK